MKTVTRALIPGLAMLLLSACAGSTTSLPQTQAGDPQAPMDFQLLADIPIPSGATMDNDRSLILGDRDRWTGRVVMRVWKSAPEAVAFYQQQMPQFGWEPVMAATSGISVMAYTRGDRAASVQIERGTMWGATVSVIVGHRPDGKAAQGPQVQYQGQAAGAPVRVAPAEPVSRETLSPQAR